MSMLEVCTRAKNHAIYEGLSPPTRFLLSYLASQGPVYFKPITNLQVCTQSWRSVSTPASRGSRAEHPLISAKCNTQCSPKGAQSSGAVLWCCAGHPDEFSPYT